MRGRILPVKSVGVQGDERSYRHPAVVWSPDGRWPAWPELNWALFWHTAAQERLWLDAKKSERLTDCWPVICWSPYFQLLKPGQLAGSKVGIGRCALK